MGHLFLILSIYKPEFRHIFIVIFAMAGLVASAQNDAQRQGLMEGLRYNVEMQASLSDGKTPLWLNANKYGLSSLEKSNGYVRAAMFRLQDTDSAFRWGIGYGVDVAVPYNYTSNIVVQQAYIEGRWLNGVLTVGSKNYPMELKNNELSSGSQTFGKNARPVPQVRLALPEYWPIPLTGGIVSLKGHIAYGKMTDDNWQHEFTQKKTKYADDVLYHSKAGYLKIGNDYRFCPWSLELGLEMASTFGGTAYRPNSDGTMAVIKNAAGLKAFWQAFVPGGSEANETRYKNFEGNQLGSWLIRLNYKVDRWNAAIYLDKYFEDHSAMFHLDYDGYGTGDEWNVKKKHKYALYDFKDMMLGLELNFDYNYWVKNVVFEYLYTKYQSGPIYHDHTPSISDHIGGRDYFYNHSIFTGWQHWGQVMGNPLYRSPIYNTDGNIMVENNRFIAFHLGISGDINEHVHYRLLATHQRGWGTYDKPFAKVQENFSLLAEGEYAFTDKRLKGLKVMGGFGMDRGKILGDNYGFQITISKTGILK